MGCAISNNNKYALIFSNTTLLTALGNTKEIYMNGTFSVVPHTPPFQQLYTMYIRYNDTGITTIFALCECRTAAMYEAIFKKIVSLVPQLQGNLQTVMCDYEKAPMEVIQAQFPTVTIHGCWFHFTQALLRRCRKLGLHGTPTEILSMAMTMALAPAHMPAYCFRTNNLVESFHSAVIRKLRIAHPNFWFFIDINIIIIAVNLCLSLIIG
ncbi:uncharacterized protein LOC128896624 [Hylaeus anthracinus]|uniref:uncharacterized protein LOC128896624 n=1 Tax=Hylaeus anthracinus TaxID=313031 RepID=UPI0023B98530|nr:uncharacterized protein LOC128896624 [Hylaeus anthracinus]